MKFSDWQSGTIAPKESGQYEVRLIAVIDSSWMTWFMGVGQHKWGLSQDQTNFQQSNGHLWQWRGRTEE